ncbi:peregrin-like [Stylophora pistillata]|uniref:Peregrin n=1 Tax=Stylophora pistillata TaxID=50429 RepID=A0A2B4RB55_STYPI|nr:peregrin-like [Stylophora pistillata]PFX15584.1 Peregrin [Stylophora pistillata]
MVNVRELIDNLRATKPPYECPLCQKIYKSYSGIEYHLRVFKHDGTDVVGTTPTTSKKGKGRGRKSVKNKKPPPSPPTLSVPRETLTYAQAQKIVEVEIEGFPHRIHINDQLDVVDSEEISQPEPEKSEDAFETMMIKPLTSLKSKNDQSNENNNRISLPSAEYSEKMESGFRHPDAPTRPTAYFRFIEQTTEELDEMVEYDMDEEDYVWLDTINDKRKAEGIAPVSQEIFETLMDRLEKESYFESQTNCDPNQYIDEDAVCCICNDGECQNSNAILFCDMCNLAVHQECYGVPYIPEGQWLCRRCLQSPSRAVDCVLCPNKTGAFKQTDTGKWGHVVCALWIPEVCFANTVFLEPIDSIENIPQARWKLTCYICKRRHGACIQCFKTNCYTAFHVTCAQQAGLYMKIEPVKGENGQVTVRKTAFCDVHTPTNSEAGREEENSEDEVKEKTNISKTKTPSKTPAKITSKSAKSAKSKRSIKKFRKLLAEKKTTAVPIVNIPFIPAHRLSKIVGRVAMARKAQFIQSLQSYWMLKRQSRNGVPLLRRLQASHQSQKAGADESSERSLRIKAMKEQLHFWQRLRHDLERARLLVELIRKREKLKREQVKVKQHVVDLQLQPLNIVLRKTLELLQTKDPGEIFAEPVDTDEVTDYLEVIDEPMDFSTISKRIDDNHYTTMEQFERDFNLVIGNCLRYNAPDTIYYRAALKMRDQGRPIVRAARRQVERAGIDPVTGLHTEEPPTLADREPTEEDFVLTEEQRRDMTLEEQLKDLQEKLDMTQAIKHGGVRATRVRMLRKEIALVRRKLNQGKRHLSESSAGGLDGSILSETCLSPLEYEEPLKKFRPIDENDSLNGTQPTKNLDTEEHRLAGDSLLNSRATANPSPGTSRRSGILFNKGRHRARRNLSSGADKFPFDILPPVNHMLKTADSDRTLDPVSTECQVTENLPTDEVGEEDTVFEDRHQPAPKEEKRPQKRHSTDNDTIYVPKKTYKTELGKLIEDATLPMFDTHFAFATNGLRQRSNRSYTSGSESDISDVRVNGIRASRELCRKLSVFSEDEELSTDTENSSADNRVMNGPVDGRKEKKPAPRPRKTTSDSDIADLPPLQPLDLVWAKCRGYPSYPALIINPRTKKGFLHHGVPIPVPPEDVLKDRAITDEHLYLVLFFDARRTWQWLPRHKLEPLGEHNERDQNKLQEGRKTSMRKSVMQAYHRAIVHRNQVERGDSRDSDDDDGDYEDADNNDEDQRVNENGNEVEDEESDNEVDDIGECELEENGFV